MNALTKAAVLVPLSVFLAVYAPLIGRGFIRDDFGWITLSRIHTTSDIVTLFDRSSGFYRPLVGLSFAANHAMFGGEALGYGWTNLILALSCAVLMVVLLRALRLGRGAALLGAGLWLLNFHGINMALLWVSGRTALLLIIGALIGTIGLLRGRVSVALFGLAVALFSKEEAVAIPVIWAAAGALTLSPERLRGRRAALLACGTVLLTAGYLALRTQAGAMTPASAPTHYRFTIEPAIVARNLLEYADRACTFAAAASLIGWLILRPARVELRPGLLAFGAVWVGAGYSLTLWLPVRSSLYACFPAVGAAMLAAAFLEACWRESTLGRRRWALAAVVAIPVACIPAYMARTERWTELADLTTMTLRALELRLQDVPDNVPLVLVDDRSQRANLQSAFGTLIEEAVFLTTGRRFDVWIEPPLDHAALAGMTPPCTECPRVHLGLLNGRLMAHSDALDPPAPASRERRGRR